MTRKNRLLPSDCIGFILQSNYKYLHQLFLISRQSNSSSTQNDYLIQLIILSLYSYIHLYILSPTIPIWS